MPTVERFSDGSVLYRCKTCETEAHIPAGKRPRCRECDRRRSEAKRMEDPELARERVEAVRKQQRLEKLVTTGAITIDTALMLGYELPDKPKGL